MRILSLHCDYIKWQAKKKAIKTIPDLDNLDEVNVEECLGIFVAVEKGDEGDVKKAVKALVENALDLQEKTSAERIVIYPYAHLSADLSKPSFAQEVLEGAEKALKKKKVDVSRAPFGYYKTFELKCKGHPLSELTRRVDLSGGGEGKVVEEDLTESERENLLRQIGKSKLDTSKLKDNDHRILGKKMDLWSFHSAAPGMAFWHSKGLHIKNKLIEYWREIHRADGYGEISTPQIMDRKLWEISGHWRLYKDNMFTTNYEGRDFAVKPMSCPGGMLVYKNSPKSYNDLPLRMGEIGVVHRQELSGVLAGLFRVIQITQDDAHVYCTQKQLHNEIVRILKLFTKMIDQFGFKKHRFTISVRSKEKAQKYLGDNKIWERAEKALAMGLDELGLKYSIEEGEAKFYGPSLDLQIKDSLDREWQCSTLQLDFALPKRFGIVYTNEKGKEEVPIMLHHVVFGSLERFMGVYTEHINGNYPLWLSPNQIKVMSLTDDEKVYAKEVYEKLFEAGFEVELDDRNETMGRKVRDAQIQRYNYIVTVGAKEKEAGTIAVKARGSKDIVEKNLDEFVGELKSVIGRKE